MPQRTNESASVWGEEDIKQNKFQLNTLKREMDLIQVTFSDKKLKMIE